MSRLGSWPLRQQVESAAQRKLGGHSLSVEQGVLALSNDGVKHPPNASSRIALRLTVAPR
jgi:hypothetical protein